MKRVAVIVVWILSGCDSSTHPEDTALSPKMEEVKPALNSSFETPAECRKAGGEWKAWCVPNTPSCVMPWPDAGKKCTDHSECESKMCIVDMLVECKLGEDCDHPVYPKAGERAFGICKREDVSCGSYIEVKKGRAQEPYHID